MTTYAVSDKNGLIINRIVLDDQKSWTLPDGYSLHQEIGTSYEMGGKFVGDIYTPPPTLIVTSPLSLDPIDAWDAVTLKIAFNHENRIRILEGKSAVTVTQFKTAVRTLLSS